MNSVHWDPSMEWERYVEMNEPPPQPRCSRCKAFLPFNPLEVYVKLAKEYEYDEESGEMVEVEVAQQIGIWVCRRCGQQDEWQVG